MLNKNYKVKKPTGVLKNVMQEGKKKLQEEQHA